MNIETLLYQYNPWWEPGYRPRSTIIKRERILKPLYSLMETPDILILTGLRRVGKTTTIKSLIQYLIETKKVPPKHCLYVSVDDYQLKNMTLTTLINIYRNTMKISVKENIYVFFDEITFINNFQIQLKNLYDQGGIKCVVSSSSSSILKDDSARLTGRKRVTEINPLDFNEYLIFKNVQLSKADQGLLDSYFVDYMKTGGMPEYVLREEREYLVSLIDDIIMKDIIGYHNIRNVTVIKDFFTLLMERSGKQISLNKVANILNISVDTARRYLKMFEQTYLIHLVPRFGKTNETLLSAKKVYATDIGMRNIIVGFRDKGAIFENIAFMAIKEKKPQYIYTEGQEIDFLVNNTLIEVKYNKDIEKKQLTAFNNFKAKNKIIIRNYHDLDKLKSI